MSSTLQRIALFPGIVILALAAAGCSTIGNYLGGEDNSEPPAELSAIDEQFQIQTVWSTDVGSGSDKRYLKLVPAWLDNTLYTADRDGSLTAVDAATGNRLWSIDTDTEILGGPGVGDGLATVGTHDGEVLAYNADNGKLEWRARVSSEVLSAPAVSPSVVVVRTIDGKLFGLDRASGERLWVYDRTVPVLTLRGTSPPVIAGDLVVAGFDSGKIVAVELSTGRLLWETPVAVASGRSELERMVDIDSTPVIVESTVYVASFQGRVAALSLETGRIRWARDISSHAGLSVDTRNVYVTDGDSHIWALDRFTGGSLWQQDVLHARSVTAPATVGEYVVVGDYDGYLHWLNSTDGKIVARDRIDSSAILTAGLSIDRVLYAYSAGGRIVAVRKP